MFESRVLGVDPGLARLGLAVVEGNGRKAALVWAGAVSTAAGSDESERLRQICVAVREAVSVHRPASMALERVAWNKNQVSALTVARATGAIMVVAADAGLSVTEYGPNEVKIAVTGMGNADKAQVRRALVRVHGLRDVPAAGGRRRRRRRGAHPSRGSAHAGSRPIGVAVISFLDGEVVEKGATRVVIGVGGVGYDVLVPTSVVAKLPSVGKTTRLHTRMVVREDSMTLYGFSAVDQRDLFDLLTGVTGVGPKVALAFLSVLKPVTLTRAIVNGDAAALTVVPGVGKKVAQRVVLDLAEKLGGEAELPSEGADGRRARRAPVARAHGHGGRRGDARDRGGRPRGRRHPARGAAEGGSMTADDETIRMPERRPSVRSTPTPSPRRIASSTSPCARARWTSSSARSA